MPRAVARAMGSVLLTASQGVFGCEKSRGATEGAPFGLVAPPPGAPTTSAADTTTTAVGGGGWEYTGPGIAKFPSGLPPLEEDGSLNHPAHSASFALPALFARMQQPLGLKEEK